MPQETKRSELDNSVASMTYPATRRTIPPAGLAAQGEVREKAAVRYEYNPHLPSRLARALGRTGLVEEAAFDDLSGLRSLPFAPPPDRRRGEPWRIAVKVIDPRGNEGLRVLTAEEPA